MKRIEDWVPMLKGMHQIGERFVARKKITADQLRTALVIQREKEARGEKERLGKILIENGSLQEDDILWMFSEELGIPYKNNLSLRTIEDDGITLSRELYKVFHLSDLESEEFLPYKSHISVDEKNEKNGNKIVWSIYCYFSDPWSYMGITRKVKQILSQHQNIFVPSLPVVTEKTTAIGGEMDLSTVEFFNIYATLANRSNILRVIEELKESRYSSSAGTVQIEEQYQTTKLFREIIETAIKQKSSDIHIAPNNASGGLEVRFRKDGDIASESHFGYGSEKFPIASYGEFINVVFDESGMDRNSKTMTAQDGAIQMIHNNVPYDMRLASMPILLGQKHSDAKLTVRILYKSGAKDITQIGMLPEQLKVVRQLYAKPEGLTLLAGPTSSGKTTTIYSILNCLDLSKQVCYTIENPVEYELKNAYQIQVEEKQGLGFAEILRNLLRQDPDIVFVGEMRDLESVESVVHIANTGHTVLSTIHANNSYKVPQRLLNMKVPPHQIFSSLNCVISQRLALRICPECSVDYVPTAKETELLTLDLDVKYKHGSGIDVETGDACPRCGGKGHIGRTGIFEILPVAMYPEWQKHVDTPDDLKSLFTSIKQGDKQLFPDLMADARAKMEMGIISPKALASVFSRLEVS